MSEQKKPSPEKKPAAAEPSTAVAKRADVGAELLASAQTFEEKQLAFTLASRVRQHEMVRQAAAAIAETGWGKDVSGMARAAVARYCLEIGADPVRHVYVLGGNVYLNAQFYQELCASNPEFIRPESDFIHEDTRASDEERERRKQLRIKYGVPEQAPGACVVTLYYKDRGPFIGVNWAGVRKNDPVGTAEPTKSAESRAYRKAAVKAEPAWFRTHPKLAHAEEIIGQGRAAPDEVDAPPPAIEPEPTEVRQIPATSGTEDRADPVPSPTIETKAPERTTSHNPSAQCGREGLHPVSECGYEKAPSA